MKTLRANRFCNLTLTLLLSVFFAACGGSSSGGGGGGGGSAPATPTGLAATPGNAKVALTWNASAGATSYTLSRSLTSGGPYTGFPAQASTTYNDTAVANGIPYYYVVSATNANGTSANSAQVLATPMLPSPPPTPTGLAAVAGSGQVALTWNSSAGATSYSVGRSTTSGGPYTTIASPATAAYTDSSVTNGTTYYYVVAAVNAGGSSTNSSQVSATPTALSPPPVPTGLAATPSSGQVALTWNSSAGATSYKVSRSTTSGGPYASIATPATAAYTDSTVTNGTTYFYVVAAVNGNGTSNNSPQVSATPTGPTTAVNVTVDVMSNRHPISAFVYGGAFPPDAAHITDSNTSVVRWGGNGASTYNWKLGTSNADNDYFFEDFPFGALNNAADSDSVQFINDVKAAGSNPLMTMVMLPWVAQNRETSTQQGNGPNNFHWSYSVLKYGSQCAVDQFVNDAGNGVAPANCSVNSPPHIAANPNDAYFPLLDGPPQGGDPANSVYRNQWAAAMATAFGASQHFYDMDNEIDIWGGTHVDIHPNGAGYNELRDTYLTEARNLKGWDAAAIRLGPVSCCWYFYWNLPSSTDNKSNHANIDFLPWWLNEVYWRDQIAGTRSVESFDIHAYPDADTNGLTPTQQKALAVKIYRDWWDPSFNSAASYIVNGGFSIEPLDGKPFRIPRIKAIINSTYPGTSMSITEWSAEFAGGSDFSTAIGDADAYGVLGREGVFLSTRWTSPDPANPNYQALKLFTNCDGAKHGFGSISVSATHNADPSLFSVYAATVPGGASATIMVLNKDPVNSAQTTFTLNGFTPSQVTTYTLSTASPTSIVAGATHAWSSTMTFAPYTATLLVISGSSTPPASEWDLNPDTTMVPASGTTTLAPKLTSGSATVSLNTAVFDGYEGAAACNGGSISLTNPTVASGTPGTITLNAPASAGFCHFSVTASDGTTKGGWLVVGKPAATLAKTAGDAQTGAHGTTLPVDLTVTLTPGSSGGTLNGASVFFTTSAGSLTNVASGNGETIFTGSKVIAMTNGSGVAKVTLTLPGTAGPVTVTAEGPFGLGHPVVTPFTETAQ